MGNDPYRSASQPADRRVINRSGAAPAYRAADEPQSSTESAPVAPQRTANNYPNYNESPKKTSKWPLWVAIAIVVLAGLGIGAWALLSSAKNPDAGIDSSRYQAVFLTNGQIYFGKLTAYNDEYLRLTTGYYPQANETKTSTDETTDVADANSGIQLIRLGDEVYGPENEIFISKKQILHYENLKTDSKVSQLIDQNEKSRR